MNITARHLKVLEGNICPYCGSSIKVIQNHDVINQMIGTNYYFACHRYPQCDSYTLGKSKVFKPLGRLANKALREERKYAYKYINMLKHTWNIKKSEITQEISNLIGTPKRFSQIVFLNYENCKKITRWAIEKNLHLEYEQNHVYTNYSARRNINDKMIYKKCVIVEQLDSRRTLIEFADGHRTITEQIRSKRI